MQRIWEPILAEAGMRFKSLHFRVSGMILGLGPVIGKDGAAAEGIVEAAARVDPDSCGLPFRKIIFVGESKDCRP